MKTLAEQIANKCRHFNGISSKTCLAGVQYDNLEAMPNSAGRYLPCFRDEAGRACHCPSQSFLTDEEVAAKIADRHRRLDNLGKARQAIVDHLGVPWTKGTPGCNGTIACPICNGKLAFSRSGYNGHIHAKCTTDDCVSWME